MNHTVRDHTKSLRRRLIISSAIAAGGVLAATMVVPSYGGDDQSESLKAAYDRAAQARSLDLDPADPEDADALAHLDGTAPDGHDHDHTDQTTKNSLSRTVGEDGAVDPATMDPTSPTQARRGVRTVATQRAEPDPRLVPAPKPAARRDSPQNRHVMAGGCYAMKVVGGGWVTGGGNGYPTAGSRSAAMPFHFQATDLGSYLLVDTAGRYVGAGGGPTLAASETTVWTVRGKKGRFTFAGPSGRLHGKGGTLTTGDGSTFALRLSTDCHDWPEIDVNVAGRPFAGTSTFQEVRGTTDAHTHGMAYEFLGGAAHCGRPWSPFGVEVALVDCPDHSATGGYGAALEALMSGEPSHDPVGWPTFRDWPAPHSLTHEGTYWKWMERAWRGGMRLFVNLLVENNQLCLIYPIKGENFPQHLCDDMKSIELQAQRMREFERYIDAQHGGPGKGWYRIVKNPFQARKVINQGKLAVVMGIETSVPFGCSTVVDIPECSTKEIDAQLKKVHRMGVRQMELVNKFDNALSGVAGDTGEIGVLVNGANFLETQSFWDMRTCPSSYDDEVSDKSQYATPEDGGLSEQRDGLFGAIAEVSGVNLPALPLYGPAPHCNNRGLTDLGKHLIRSMVDKGMIFDPDHMSVKARQSSLDLLEELDYSGVISSHSWSTPDAYPRIYKLGGVVMPYAGDSTGFVEKWKRHLTWADPRYYFGFGYGADINGLGAQGNPRGADAKRPVTYPFQGLGGVTVNKQVSGERVYDINVDGVAHYGLYPDWLEDLRRLGGNDIVTDMSRGAEAYLQMWERAQGVTNDACREPALAKKAKAFRGLADGLKVTKVLKRMGQPHQRLDRTFTYCARSGAQQGGDLTRLKLRFDRKGRLL